ncbi:cation-translocating P-type ATPase [Nostoc spongiaeforme FACHB-130]|uniref:Cation-translocating P-type ATPase n=1 Tax=Nostoc spongiaeforme FACHB-130 TaxID=1357510 RepID=A0ABR8FZ35_9NOSO|nr:cation-translocating P-type ATPase [Nostoc spongiaeforme]MBD2595603.1 cation-translocating P-type ATPase [Nostoc spongiaeforme FACHB-130]
MLNQLNLDTITGLSEQEATYKLKREGFNELPSSKQRNILAIAAEVLQEPIFLLLVGCGAIYIFLGELQDALILLGFVFFIMGITLYQEQKTEHALEALRDLSSPRASVIRDGQQKRIAGREVVRGDMIILAEGDRVPADATLLSCTHFTVDESLLTGESVPVRKVVQHGNTFIQRPGGDDLPFVYSGTLIVAGQGVAEVTSTGIHTEIGKIGKALQTVTPEETLLQKETGQLVKKLAIVAIAICVAIIVIYGLTRGNWLNGFLAGLALAMAILPNEFPVVVTIFLALGAWRISQKRVLARRMPAVETLGSATVLCVDKTGTLTFNQMSVNQMFAQGEVYHLNQHEREPLPETFHQLVEFSILASQKDPFDPMEKAFKNLGNDYLANTEHLHNDWNLIHEYPLSPHLLAMSHVWQSPTGADYIIAAKGAPEAIADLCHFDSTQMQQLAQKITQMANAGLRILGVAKAYFQHTALPGEQHDFNFEFLGLVGLADPVRPTVKAAIQECYTAGIQVVMITGDYPGTAQNIARQISLEPSNQVITGSELEQMDDSELSRRIKTVNIFARVVPEQKLRLVNALKNNGEIVAMTGDGVNDAPALKSAHIGIAMGGRGTDVAREAADLVLLDDDFSSIVEAVKLGRRIFDNLKKAMAYTLAVHVPIAGMSLIPVLFKWPLVLLPIHIAFLHLIIDPACSVVFEAEPPEINIMRRPPRNPKEPLFSQRTLGLAVLQGVGILLVLLIVFATALCRGQGELDARALTFTTLIIANLSLILTNRSWSRTIWEMLRSRSRRVSPEPSQNVVLWWVLGGALVFLAFVLYLPLLRHLFRFSILHPIDLAICFTAGIMSILWFEQMKILYRNKRASI